MLWDMDSGEKCHLREVFEASSATIGSIGMGLSHFLGIDEGCINHCCFCEKVMLHS